MSFSTFATLQRQREALCAWAAAVKAVQVESHRLADGGEHHRSGTPILLLAVELARLECQLLRVDPGIAHLPI